MATIRLKYIDSAGAIQTETVEIVSLRGFDDPDSVSFVPPILYSFIDGTRRTAFRGFRRVIYVDFGVIPDESAHRAILAFMQSDTRSVFYNSVGLGYEEIFVLPQQSEYENEWLDECRIGKRYVLQLTENVIRNVWSSYTPPSTVDIMYIKNHVRIVGTQASPETFTTNSEKLDVDETGTTYPAMSLLSFVATVIVNGTPYQDAKINMVGVVTNSGNNLTFQLAVSDGGAPSEDGYYYADIIIGLQARP